MWGVLLLLSNEIHELDLCDLKLEMLLMISYKRPPLCLIVTEPLHHWLPQMILDYLLLYVVRLNLSGFPIEASGHYSRVVLLFYHCELVDIRSSMIDDSPLLVTLHVGRSAIQRLKVAE